MSDGNGWSTALSEARKMQELVEYQTAEIEGRNSLIDLLELKMTGLETRLVGADISEAHLLRCIDERDELIAKLKAENAELRRELNAQFVERSLRCPEGQHK